MAIADDSRWRFVVTDLNGNPANGGGMVLNSSVKQYSRQINAGRTAQFQIGIDNPRSSYLLTNDTLIKVYRKTRVSKQWKLLMVGDTIQAEESGDGSNEVVTVVATDPLWRLQRRVIGMGTNSIGQGSGYTDGTALSQKNYSTLISDMVNAVNTVFPTGVVMGTIQNAAAQGYIGPVYGQNVGDLLIQLTSSSLGGPDWDIQPLEPSGTMPHTTIGQMNLWSNLGQVRPNAAFEYGTGKKNVVSYSRVLDKNGLANLIYAPPQGFPTNIAAGDAMVSASDTVSQNAIGRFEEIAQGSIISQPLRQEICNEYLAVLKYARQQILFVPSQDIPLDYTVDYDIGDIVTARAFANGGYRYNGTVRLYGVSFTIDDNDVETPTLTLIPTGEGGT